MYIYIYIYTYTYEIHTRIKKNSIEFGPITTNSLLAPKPVPSLACSYVDWDRLFHWTRMDNNLQSSCKLELLHGLIHMDMD